ncbi:MAG: hypothetical protein ACRDK7_03670 [Solirubrobacteraceae bacterium]
MAPLMLALYPLAFRRRYGAEMQAHVDEESVGLRTLMDLLRGALVAHLRPTPGLAEDLDVGVRLRLGLSGVLACWLAFAAAGFAFYNTTEDHPFSTAASVHPLLGDSHRGIQIFAVLASGAVLVGAAPLVVLALKQARREGGRLRLLVSLPFIAVILFATATGLLVVLAHSQRAHPATTASQGAFVAWGLSGLVCGAVCVVAARKALFAIPVPRAWLVRALSFATLVAGTMPAITLATALYAITLPIDASNLAGEPNGPFQVMSTGVSLVVQLIAMSACGALAMTSTRRAWRGMGN